MPPRQPALRVVWVFWTDSQEQAICPRSRPVTTPAGWPDTWSAKVREQREDAARIYV